MNRKFYFTLLLLLFIQLISFKTSSQEKDTVYFDENWSICEKPVAAYYRVCTLNKDKQIFYKGDAEDYYLDGKIEMKGHYANNGYKDGNFIFYTENGNKSIEGKFIDNHMSGGWLFYNSSGKLTTQINCKDEAEFTPLLIIDKNGDTILKNGNGKFILDMQNQLPAFYYGRKSYIIEGEVKQGLKDGTYSCYITLPTKRLLFSAIYRNGKLKPAESQYNNVGSGLMNIADYQYSLVPSNLVKIDQFNHTNFVFEYNYDAENKLINFLVNNETPFIIAKTTTTKENDVLFFDLIENVLYDTLMKTSSQKKDIHYKKFKYPLISYYSAAYSKNERNTFPKIHGDITLTIDTGGYIINSAFTSNLAKQQINKINYYLGHILNLAPNSANAEKSLYNVNLKLDMLIDTLKDDSFHVSYLIYNNDSVSEKDLASYIDTSSVSTSVQIEAKFPGGQDTWRKYLERNLNIQTPADHGAPPGNYTVTVSFLVDKEGNISEVQALTNPGYGTAEEAVRVIKKGPKWVPAVQYGRNVIYRQKQNITFQVTRQ